MNMNPPQTEYRSYLVRLWRSSDKDPWRVMIEQVGSNERRMFTNLENLLYFLQSDGDDAGSNDEGKLPENLSAHLFG